MLNKPLSLAIMLALGTASLAACQTTRVPTEPASVSAVEQQAFAAYSEAFIESLWQIAPTWALYSGYHKYDGILQIPDEASRQQTLDFVNTQRDLLKVFDLNALTPKEVTDYRLIENLLNKLEWQISTFKAWQWTPSSYNVAGGFAQIINEDFAPLDERLRSVISRLANVPAYYEAARTNINNPTLQHTELAVMQNKGAFSVLSEGLKQKVADSGLSQAEKALFNERFTLATTAIGDHISWLEQLAAKLKQEGARDFRIGEALYEQKFAMDIQAGMSAKALYEKAMDDKARVQGEMAKLTKQLWPKYFTKPMPTDDKVAIRELIDHLSVRHVKREDFVSEVRQQIPELNQFVVDKQLITLDPNKPLVVRETPAYMRGFAGASISAPGPYDKGGNTYYNVTPLDAMTPAQAESYLREYNHWILQILNIHEAIPGHYTQLVYANESPSMIKSLFGNGAMIEGWAVYTERMMLEEGYGDFEPELWLMYYKWNLRVICNTILDYSIQVLGMEQQEAIELLTQEAFQEQTEAEGKWRRATLSQVQLTSYYSGYREIYDFREEFKGIKGHDFDLRDFHETFLSFGSSPVKYVRELMLTEK